MIIVSLFCKVLSNAVALRRDKSILFSKIVLFVILYNCLLTYISYFEYLMKQSIGLYGGLLHVTSITQTFYNLLYIISLIIVQLNSYYPRKIAKHLYFEIKADYLKIKDFLYNTMVKNLIMINKNGEQFKIIEYSLILLFIINGAVLLMSTSDLVSIFISIELQSYGLYLLSTIYKNSELATRGGLTYFLLGGLSSCFILLGISLLYVNSATTNLDGIYIITNISENKQDLDNYIYKGHYINISFIILSAGFLFKVSAAPFHF